MLSFFRRRAEARRKIKQTLAVIHVHGNSYFRHEDDIVCYRSNENKFTACTLDHVAPNGVSIQQIACALAAIEGRIQVRLGTVNEVRRERWGIGLN